MSDSSERMAAIRASLDEWTKRSGRGSTHWDGCESVHPWCAIGALLAAYDQIALERDMLAEATVRAYQKAQDHWCAQCFCFTLAPEQLRRDAHETARDGFNEIVSLISTVARPFMDEL